MRMGNSWTEKREGPPDAECGTPALLRNNLELGPVLSGRWMRRETGEASCCLTFCSCHRQEARGFSCCSY